MGDQYLKDELRKTQSEVLHLKDTIGALREKLEDEHASKTDAVQLAVAARNGEVEQLIATVTALREKLEGMGFIKDQCVQEATKNAHNEIILLKETISALREKLELANAER